MKCKAELSPLGKSVLDYKSEDFIYRILQFDHLKAFFESQTLLFPRTASWDDSYENFIFKASYRVGDKDLGAIFENFNYEERFFGLCWSHWSDSDALWRIYSPDKSRVQIKVNVGKLKSAFLASIKQCPFEVFFALGRVVYIDNKNLDALFSHEMLLNNGDLSFLAHDGFFVKRTGFDYENEFRTIIVGRQPLPEINLFPVTIDPNEIIEEVVFDPRIDDGTADEFSRELDRLGFKNYRKSALYDQVDLHLSHNKKSVNEQPFRRF